LQRCHERARRDAARREVRGMGYIIAWLLGVPVTLLILFWLFFGS
jgi:hypothetical protein